MDNDIILTVITRWIILYGLLNIGSDCKIEVLMEDKKTLVQIIEANFGENILLNCPANRNGSECIWQRNGNPVIVKGRYRYTQKPESTTKRTICTISIESVQTIDRGKWDCLYDLQGYDHFDGISQSYVIRLKTASANKNLIPRNTPGFLQHPGPEMVAVPDNGTYILSCLVDRPAHCFWQYDGHIVNFYYAYISYTPSEASMVDTLDCSIRLKKFQYYWRGQWRCITAADDTMDSSTSIETFLTKPKAINPTLLSQQPQNATLTLGFPHIFNCIFTKKLSKCVWTRNGVEINDFQWYGHDIPGSCSIKLDEFAIDLVGEWQCYGYEGNDTLVAKSSPVWLLAKSNGKVGSCTTYNLLIISVSAITSLSLLATLISAYCIIRIKRRKTENTCEAQQSSNHVGSRNSEYSRPIPRNEPPPVSHEVRYANCRIVPEHIENDEHVYCYIEL